MPAFGFRTIALASAFAVCLLLFGSAPARSDDPVTSAVRFNREIVRIFDRKCLPCHADGTIGMPLATYREARPWARAIREEIVEGRMPPWSAARGSVRFTGDIGLTPRELTTILTWVDGGLPKGDDADLPPAARPPEASAADVTLQLPPQSIPGSGEDIVRRVTIAAGLTADRRVRQLRIAPGDRRLLRAAFASIVPPSGRGAAAASVWAAAWTPWQPAMEPPGDCGFFVPAGSHIAVELHYRGGDAAAVDRTVLQLRFAPVSEARDCASSVAVRAIRRIAPGRWSGTRGVAHVTTVWALRPEGVADGGSLEVTAHEPDGRVQVLLWIPRFRADWPAPFVLTRPVTLPAGTRLRVTAGGATPAAAAVLAIRG